MSTRVSWKTGRSRRAGSVRHAAPNSPFPGPSASRTERPLSRAEARSRIEGLSREIRRHDYLYYALDRPEISDEEYDRLFGQLRRFEEAFPELVRPDSPTQRVAGAPLPFFRQVRHLAPLLSLDSVTDPEDVRRFDARLRATLRRDRLEYVAEPKLDGLSVEVVYARGLLVRASTRGDGLRGEGVTENVKTIRSLPLRLQEQTGPAPRLLAVRGEVLMPVAAFRRLNADLERQEEPPFANPRNAAAGSLRQLDPRISAGRRLDILFYDILRQDGGTAAPTQWEALEAMRAWGLPVSEHRRRIAALEEVFDYHRELQQLRDALRFEIDGIVIKVDDLPAHRLLQATARHPRWALAFKFAPRGEETTIENIVVQVGRTGVLTPVAVLSPVKVGGVTVTRATLHNREEVARRDLSVGDRVRVVRAGDVIPEVVERLASPGARRRRPFRMPRRCPECRAETVREGPFDRCPNGLACRAQLARAIQHFGSRSALDIRGLGRKTVEQLVGSGRVRNVADLFSLTQADLSRVERFGDLSAGNLIRSIGRSKHADLGRFLYALGIPEVGEQTARDLAAHFGSLEAIRGGEERRLRDAERIGPSVAKSVAHFFRRSENRRVIALCLRRGLDLTGPARAARGPLAGKTVVFTGILGSLSREQARELVRRSGGRPSESVSRRTDYLVAGTDPGSKSERAGKLGIRTLDEKSFLRLVRGQKE